MSSLFYHFRRQRDVACDYEITKAEPLDYLVVGDIKPGLHLKRVNEE